VIFDTDILILFSRKHAGAGSAIAGAPQRCVALQTALEFLQGSPNQGLMTERKRFLHDFEFEILPLSQNIGHRAMIYIEEHALAHGLRSADALIAATAVENGMTLCSANAKHFRAIKDLSLKIIKA